MDIASPSSLLPYLSEALPGLVTLYVPPTDSDNEMRRRMSVIATSVGMRLEYRTLTTSHVPLQWCVVVKRVSAIDPARQAYAVVLATHILSHREEAEAGRFLRRKLFDILDSSPQSVAIYQPEPPRLPKSILRTSVEATYVESDCCEAIPDKECTPMQRCSVSVPESDMSLDDEKRQWVDSLTSLVLQYITRFHEAPPMHLIQQEIRGKLLLSPAPVSPITVSGDMRIYLPAFNEMELRMTPLARTVYILFLCHPEGIRLKNISDYAHELTELYYMVKPGSDSDLAAAYISDLIDPTGDSLQQKLSLTRRAVRRQILDESLAGHYMIRGTRGGTYSIPLSESMIHLPAVLRHA